MFVEIFKFSVHVRRGVLLMRVRVCLFARLLRWAGACD